MICILACLKSNIIQRCDKGLKEIILGMMYMLHQLLVNLFNASNAWTPASAFKVMFSIPSLSLFVNTFTAESFDTWIILVLSKFFALQANWVIWCHVMASCGDIMWCHTMTSCGVTLQVMSARRSYGKNTDKEAIMQEGCQCSSISIIYAIITEPREGPVTPRISEAEEILWMDTVVSLNSHEWEGKVLPGVIQTLNTEPDKCKYQTIAIQFKDGVQECIVSGSYLS